MIRSKYPQSTRSHKITARKPNCLNGLTLVEVVVAMAILALVISSAIAVMTQSFIAIDHSRNLNRVSQILQTEMETLRTYSWTELNALPSESDFDPFSGVTSFNMINLVCKRYLIPEKVNQKRIRLLAQWTDSRGKQYQRFYDAYYTKEGLSDYYSRIL